MKLKNTPESKKTRPLNSGYLTLLALSLAACNSAPAPERSVAQQSDWLSRSAFDGARLVIDAEPNGDSELIVKSVDGPDSIKPMFANLVLHTADTKPGPKQILFRIHADYVTAFKLVPATEPLSPAEARLAEPDPSSEQVTMIPIFKYQVKSFGVLVRSGEKSRFVPSQWADATHVRISTAAEDRIEIAPVARSLQMASKPTPGRRVRLPDVLGYSPILTEGGANSAPLLPST